MRYNYKLREILPGFAIKGQNKLKALYGDSHLVSFRLSKSWIPKLISRAMILALVILSLPLINSLIGDVAATSRSFNGVTALGDQMNTQMLSTMFHDLKNEGVLKSADRALFPSNVNGEALHKFEEIVSYNKEQQDDLMIPEEGFGFVFTSEYPATSDLIERSLKIGGIAVVQFSDRPFEKPSNFKIVYLRRFDSTMMMAMRKISHRYDDSSLAATQRKLLSDDDAKKKEALRKLEDVLLEPPRAASGKSNRYIKRTRFLPDLIGDSLESYPRRVFIDVGSTSTDWFVKNYPTKNQHFEMYNIDTVAASSSSSSSSSEAEAAAPPQSQAAAAQSGISDWLEKNVKENEYVVMKAEAGVVEEMIQTKAIRLVDELFLECKHQGIKRGQKSRRAYWECLSLYGVLRDEGIAAHQWWG